jgi:sterol desaturase/sphingolipid hydroxylase (fatty acid hydroxylase superfamily)
LGVDLEAGGTYFLTMAERAYISRSSDSVRMFDSDLVESLSRVHPVTPLVIYLPLIAGSLYFAHRRMQLSILSVAELFVLGLAIWTLLEYVIHRYLFHYEPKSRIGKQFHFIVHGVHHDYPNDAKRLVMPPAVSIPLAILFYGFFSLIFGAAALAVWAGFAAGYVCYDGIHYAIHHFPMKAGLLNRLKQHHLRHHFADDKAGYGVSSPLWDYVFRTNRR